jgi:tetratricopeptide (TPR) repeat protein
VSRFLPEAQALLDWQRGREPDAEPVLERLRIAAAQDDAEAYLLLGLASSVGFGATRDLEQAASHFINGARLGNSDSEALLGFAYLVGFGVEQDFSQAEAHLRSAADRNSALALYLLGNALRDQFYSPAGSFTSSYTEGEQLLERGARLGFLPALNSIAFQWLQFPLQFSGFAGYSAVAIPLFERLLAEGSSDPFVFNNLGVVARSDRRFEDAKRLFESALSWTSGAGTVFFPWAPLRADAIHPSPHQNLAELLRSPSPSVDAPAAFRELIECTKGFACELEVGWSLEYGIGTSPDLAEAVRYYRRAAARGERAAWTRLRSLDVGP